MTENKLIYPNVSKNTLPENIKLIDNFNNLIKQIKYDIDNNQSNNDKLKNMFRLKHIKHAINIISHFPTIIKSGKDLIKIKGIGKGIMDRIDEIIKTGKLGEINITHLSDKYLQYTDELEKVYGIGRIKAIELINVYNIKNVTELKKAYENNKISLPQNIIMGLKYYGIYKQNIPRAEIFEYDLSLHKILTNFDKKIIGVICGSYRRLFKESNDIDLLLVHPDIYTMSQLQQSNILQKIINEFKKNNIIIDSLTDTNFTTKFMGFSQLNNYHVRRIDIRFMPYDSYYTSLLYFTGSGEFNRKMRLLASQMNYKLNEYGLYKKLKNNKYKKIHIASEKDIFNHLHMEYINPPFRK
jgi:DNA polymerase/3'-5' exonuclease PolX